MDVLSFKSFSSLPKSGKPSIKGAKREWTVLATIIQNESLVVALGTGTKCLPASASCKWGSKVSDCHAEVVAKRSFQKYLYSQLDLAIQGQKSIMEYNTKTQKYKIDPNIKFSMYVSYAPCGDASMSTLNDKTEQEMEIINEKKRRHAESREQDAKRFKGVLRGRDHLQQLGMPRTKPGRADAEHTNCMSCTDKLLRWACLGLNGSLLSLLIEPVFIDCLVVGDGLNEQDLARFIARIEKVGKLPFRIVLSDGKFDFGKTAVKEGSNDQDAICCDAAIAWNLEYKHGVQDKNNSQVVVNGRKQGAPKKVIDHEARKRARVGICKAEFLARFVGAIEHAVQAGIVLLDPISNIEALKKMTYKEIKALNVDYSQCRDSFIEKMGGWSDKDGGLEDFKVD